MNAMVTRQQDQEADRTTVPPDAECRCPICGGSSLRSTIWSSGGAAKWPAVECRACGAVTREKHMAPVSSREPEPDPRRCPTWAPPARKRRKSEVFQAMTAPRISLRST